MQWERLTLWHWLGGAALLGAAVWFGPQVMAAASSGGCRGPKNRPLLEQLARKWSPIFGAPVPTILTIMQIESSFRPGCVNQNERAMLRGGAWGAMQVTLSTALGQATKLAKHTDARVRATLSRWNRTGPGLLDPDVNVMFGSEFLGRLSREFGDPVLVAAAYHQGAGKVRQMRRDGQAIPAELPPKGKIYVASFMKAQRAIAGGATA